MVKLENSKGLSKQKQPISEFLLGLVLKVSAQKIAGNEANFAPLIDSKRRGGKARRRKQTPLYKENNFISLGARFWYQLPSL